MCIVFTVFWLCPWPGTITYHGVAVIYHGPHSPYIAPVPVQCAIVTNGQHAITLSVVGCICPTCGYQCPMPPGPGHVRSRRGAGQGIGGAVQRGADAGGVKPIFDLRYVIRRQLEADPSSAEFLGHHQRSAAAAERIEHNLVRHWRRADDPPQKLLRHLAAVKALALLERAAHPQKEPGVVVRRETVGDVLRAEDPGVVGQTALGVRPLVAVDQRRADLTRTAGSSALNVKFFGSATKWNRCVCERLKARVQFTPNV